MNIECPHCYATFYSSEYLQPGDEIECPNCGEVIKVNEEDLCGDY